MHLNICFVFNYLQSYLAKCGIDQQLIGIAKSEIVFVKINCFRCFFVTCYFHFENFRNALVLLIFYQVFIQNKGKYDVQPQRNDDRDRIVEMCCFVF